MAKRLIEYEIKMEGGASDIRGKLTVSNGQSLASVREEIEKMQDWGANCLVVESPQAALIQDAVVLVVLREKKAGSSRKYSETSSIYFEEESMIEKNQSHRFIYQEPEAPPKVIGRVRECYKFFSCLSSDRVMVLNFEAVKFLNSDDEDAPARRVIPLSQIEEVKPYRKQDLYFLRIRTQRGESLDLKFQSKEICKEWIGYFHQAIEYHQYLEEKEGYSRSESFKNFVKTLYEKEKDGARVVKLEDSTMLPKPTEDEEHSMPPEPYFAKKTNSIRNQTKLADFEVTHKIGSGAFSSVYKARNIKDNRIFALKQLSKDQLLYRNQMKYAMTELSILRKCQSCPFIVNLGYAFQTEDYLYLALRYMPFGNLKELLDERGKLPFEVAFKILCELVIAIEYLHERNILYRDLKPENIMLNGDGHLSLIDFGLSIELDEKEEFAESFVGTPLYLAPERLEGSGKVNFKADIYGVGCIFYLMLHGRAPYEAGNLESIIYNIKNTSLEIDSSLPEIAQLFISDTLEKNTEKRTSHMSSHPLFEKVDWKRANKAESAILKLKPRLSGHYEVKNVGDKDYTEENYPSKKIANWAH